MSKNKLAVTSISILVSAYLVFSLVVVPRLFVYADKSPITRNPAELGMTYQDITIKPKDVDINLQAWWMPAKDAKATMVFVHGGTSNRHTQYFKALSFYQTMVAQSISVLALDLRNHGASDFDDNGVQFGLTEKNDVIAAIDWVVAKTPELPIFATGISMGGATVIYTTNEDSRLAGSILIDPLLDTQSVVINSAYVAAQIPYFVSALTAWSTINFYGLPGAGERALDIAKTINKPMLLIQDPTDPVTVLKYAKELAQANASISFWQAPTANPSNPALADKGLWATHVAAFQLYPEQTTTQIMNFIQQNSPVK